MEEYPSHNGLLFAHTGCYLQESTFGVQRALKVTRKRKKKSRSILSLLGCPIFHNAFFISSTTHKNPPMDTSLSTGAKFNQNNTIPFPSHETKHPQNIISVVGKDRVLICYTPWMNNIKCHFSAGFSL